MAQQGMFGNQYEQAVTAEALAREEAANTQGMTGWAAITQGMSTMGSNLGYAAGSAFGGRTDAEVKQDNYQSILNSVPNFDPSSAESMNEMASAMWNGGEYDQGMQFYDRGQKMIVDNLNVEAAKLKIAEYSKPETLSVSDQINSNKAVRIAEAAALVQGMPRTTSAEMDAVSQVLIDAGYTDTPEFKNLRSNLTTTKGVELSTSKEIQTNEEQEARVQREMKIKAMGEVMDRGEGPNIVGGVFLRNKPDTGSATKTIALQKQIGGVLQSYDGILSKRGLDSKLTPAEAYPYYDKVFNLPEIYQGNSGIDFKFKSYEFDGAELYSTLDTIFGVGDLFVPPEKMQSYIDNGLLIPGVTSVFNVSTGETEIYNPQ